MNDDPSAASAIGRVLLALVATVQVLALSCERREQGTTKEQICPDTIVANIDNESHVPTHSLPLVAPKDAIIIAPIKIIAHNDDVLAVTIAVGSTSRIACVLAAEEYIRYIISDPCTLSVHILGGRQIALSTVLDFDDNWHWEVEKPKLLLKEPSDRRIWFTAIGSVIADDLLVPGVYTVRLQPRNISIGQPELDGYQIIFCESTLLLSNP